jgi:hypothetical protein
VKDKHSLLVGPSGALTALPFHLLVTDKPVAAIPEKLEGYRDAAWLLRRHAASVSPSVASLKALRGFARREQAVKPMTGFGALFNPALGQRRGQAGRHQVSLAQRDQPRLHRFLAGRRRRSSHARIGLVAVARYRGRIERGRKGPRRCCFRHSSRHGCERDHGEAQPRSPITVSYILPPTGSSPAM